MRVRLVGCIMVLCLTGCVSAPSDQPPPEQAYYPGQRIPPPPSTKQVWVKDGWQRNGDDFVWVKAHYVTVKVRHHRWVREHLAPDGRVVPAHWET